MKYDLKKNAYFFSKAFTNIEVFLEFSVHIVLISIKHFKKPFNNKEHRISV